VPHPGELVTLDASQERAMALFLARSNVALLGRAGCGKSEVMRRMIMAARSKWGNECVAVGALSGSAALVIGGQTLHSLFGMNTRPLSREAWLRETLSRPQVVKRFNALRVLIMDEVCTLSSQLFTRFGYVMRRVGPPHMQHLPFGGCQVVGTFFVCLCPCVIVEADFPDLYVYTKRLYRALSTVTTNAHGLTSMFLYLPDHMDCSLVNVTEHQLPATLCRSYRSR